MFLLYFLMLEIGDFTLRKHKDAIVGLAHDHCDCDAALLEAFNQMIDDPDLIYRNRFTGLVPARWGHCIPLQPADFFAYENFKEAIRRKEMSRRKRRKSLKLLLDQANSIGGNLKSMNRANLRHFKKIMDEMNEETKDILLRTARIRTVRRNDAKPAVGSSQRHKDQVGRGKSGESKKPKA